MSAHVEENCSGSRRRVEENLLKQLVARPLPGNAGSCTGVQKAERRSVYTGDAAICTRSAIRGPPRLCRCLSPPEAPTAEFSKCTHPRSAWPGLGLAERIRHPRYSQCYRTAPWMRTQWDMNPRMRRQQESNNYAFQSRATSKASASEDGIMLKKGISESVPAPISNRRSNARGGDKSGGGAWRLPRPDV